MTKGKPPWFRIFHTFARRLRNHEDTKGGREKTTEARRHGGQKKTEPPRHQDTKGGREKPQRHEGRKRKTTEARRHGDVKYRFRLGDTKFG
jgi:hypothetical protein